MTIRKRRKAPPPEPIAGNGLLDRRMLLGRGIMFAGATTTGVGALLTGAVAEPLKADPWSEEIGAVVPSIQLPSRFEKNVVRTRSAIPTGTSAPRMRARPLDTLSRCPMLTRMHFVE